MVPGVLERRREAAANDWLIVAQELLDIRVGTPGVPPWHAVELRGAGVLTPTSLFFTPDGRLLVNPGCYVFRP